MNSQVFQTASDAASRKFLQPHEQRTDGLHQLFEHTVDATPDRIALVCEGVEYSYQELDWQANRMAWLLHSNGVGAGDKVGILLDRAMQTYAAVIAILKLGAAYVPLDASFPAERKPILRKMLRAAC